MKAAWWNNIKVIVIQKTGVDETDIEACFFALWEIPELVSFCRAFRLHSDVFLQTFHR